MKRRDFIGGAALTCLAAAVPGAATAAPLASLKPWLTDQLAMFPGAVVVIRDGADTLHLASGFADREAGLACTMETNFRLASLTKTFTAFAILMLVADGRLKLDTRLAEIFSETPSKLAAITVLQLLTHTSGLIEYDELWRDTSGKQLTDVDVLRLAFASNVTAFAPGTDFAYSNTGFCILSLIVERVTGQRFDAFLQASIFQPLGMRSSVAYTAGMDEVANRAFGYSKEGSAFVRTDQNAYSGLLGDGGIYSSARDLMLWEAALRRRWGLPDWMWRHIETPAPLSKGKIDGHGYGLGWVLGNSGPERWAYHDGATIGFRTNLMRSLDRDRSVIVLINQTAAPMFPMLEALHAKLGWGILPKESGS